MDVPEPVYQLVLRTEHNDKVFYKPHPFTYFILHSLIFKKTFLHPSLEAVILILVLIIWIFPDIPFTERMDTIAKGFSLVLLVAVVFSDSVFTIISPY